MIQKQDSLGVEDKNTAGVSEDKVANEINILN